MEWSIIMSILNTALAVAVFYYARKRDATDGAAGSTEVIVELRTVRRDVSELKNDVQSMRTEWKTDHDLLTGLVREMTAMWKIIDRLQEREGDKND